MSENNNGKDKDFLLCSQHQPKFIDDISGGPELKAREAIQIVYKQKDIKLEIIGNKRNNKV